MPSMLLRRDDVIVGVDTHKDEHVAVLLDGLGGNLAELFIPATLAGFAQLLVFCLEHVGSNGCLFAFGSRAPAPTEWVWPGSCAGPAQGPGGEPAASQG